MLEKECMGKDTRECDPYVLSGSRSCSWDEGGPRVEGIRSLEKHFQTD